MLFNTAIPSGPKAQKATFDTQHIATAFTATGWKNASLVLSTDFWRTVRISVGFDLFAEGTSSVAFLCLAHRDDRSSICQSQPTPHSTWACLLTPRATMCSNHASTCLSPPLYCEGRDPASPYARFTGVWAPGLPSMLHNSRHQNNNKMLNVCD